MLPISSPYTSLFFRVRSCAFFLLSCVVVCLPCRQASAFLEIARGELKASVNGLLTYDSNIFASSSEVGDAIYTFAPSLIYTRSAGLTALSLRAGAGYNRYDRYKAQNSNNYRLTFAVNSDALAKTDLSMGAKFSRQSKANEVVNTITRSERYSFNVDATYDYSEKITFSLGGSYVKSKFITEGFNNTENIGISGSANYIYSPKLSYSLRASGSKTRALDGGTTSTNSKNYNISIGANGDLLPKVSGSTYVGVAFKEFQGSLSSDATVSMSVDLTWKPQSKTSVTLGSSRNFQTSPQDQSIEATTVRLSLDQKIDSTTTGTISTRYSHNVFSSVGSGGRTDKIYGITFGLGKTIGKSLSLNLSYGFASASSGESFATYNRHVTSVSASYMF